MTFIPRFWKFFILFYVTVQTKRHCSPRIYRKILIGNIFIMKQLASHSVQGKIIKHDGLLLYLKSSPKGLASSCSVSSLAEAARRRRGRSEARTASRHALGSPTSRSLSADKETLFDYYTVPIEFNDIFYSSSVTFF